MCTLYTYLFSEETWISYRCNLFYLWYKHFELICYSVLDYSLNNSNFIMIINTCLMYWSLSNCCRRSTVFLRVTVTARNPIPDIDDNLFRVKFYHPTKFGWHRFKTDETHSEHTDRQTFIYISKIWGQNKKKVETQLII